MTENWEPLANGSRKILPAEERGRELAGFASKAQAQLDWYAALDSSEPRAIIAAIAQLRTTVGSETYAGAFRDAARAMVEVKLTEQMLEQMERLERRTAELERASYRLGWIAIAVAVVLGAMELIGRVL